ncbi:hypothetical protein KSP39_PZI000584 [Platanthera zijinensis]|uniref:Uncharacterized protein n=1 Tax=Platanthera zijinensis TaxID=2320716 RepID=A0AAP0C247_9ASPA
MSPTSSLSHVSPRFHLLLLLLFFLTAPRLSLSSKLGERTREPEFVRDFQIGASNRRRKFEEPHLASPDIAPPTPRVLSFYLYSYRWFVPSSRFQRSRRLPPVNASPLPSPLDSIGVSLDTADYASPPSSSFLSDWAERNPSE